MLFATPVPGWWLILLACAWCVFVVRTYRRPLVPLSPWQHAALTALRMSAGVIVLVLIARPQAAVPPDGGGQLVVPVLVDTSKSMAIADAGAGSSGAENLTTARTRLSQAVELATRGLLPALASVATVDLLQFSDGVRAADPTQLVANGRSTDLAGAINVVRSRYAGRRVPGIVVISDGADTQGGEARETTGSEGDGVDTLPVFAVGVGSAAGVPDREVSDLAVSDPRVDQVAVDVVATVRTRGLGRDAFDVRLLENGQVRETQHLQPSTDDAALSVKFLAYPNPLAATVYSVQAVADGRERVVDNNQRSAAVGPAGARRRVLVVAGAPGYDATFLVRALQDDPAFDVDVIVRKGKNDANHDTFVVQAGEGRAASLAQGFPGTSAQLFAYDALVLLNLEADFFSRAQLEMVAAFVERRGGGLLTFGARSFERRGYRATPLEPVLPLEADRPTRGARDFGVEPPAAHDVIVATDEGRRHPIMRAPGEADAQASWRSLPALAPTSPLGDARSGATVLAITRSSSGVVLPVVAVQRFGRGRSMVFAGEASWRWKMLTPAGDRRYDVFWRQSLRWLSADAPTPVLVTPPAVVDVGRAASLRIDVRDATFAPVRTADLEVRVTGPDGRVLSPSVTGHDAGEWRASVAPPVSGLYRVDVSARSGGAVLGSSDRWFLAADGERELADPRLHDSVLRRVAAATGGRYVSPEDVSSLIPLLSRISERPASVERRDVWQQPWIFATMVLLLAVEWSLRRWWGLR